MRVEISLAAMVLLAGCYEIDNGVRLNKLTGGTCIVDAVRPEDREKACEGTQRPETLAMWKAWDERMEAKAWVAAKAAAEAEAERVACLADPACRERKEREAERQEEEAERLRIAVLGVRERRETFVKRRKERERRFRDHLEFLVEEACGAPGLTRRERRGGAVCRAEKRVALRPKAWELAELESE